MGHVIISPPPPHCGLSSGHRCEYIKWQANIINVLCHSPAFSLLKWAVMSRLCWVWIIDPGPPSLTPKENWLHTPACFPAMEGHVNALVLVTKTYCIFLISGVSICSFCLHTCMFYTVFLRAQCCAWACAYMGVLVSIPTYTVCVYACNVCVCVISLREIISSNVHWPDSSLVLCFFRCINILEESPGESESLCKHNHHESVHVLCTVGLIIRTETGKFAHTVF